MYYNSWGQGGRGLEVPLVHTSPCLQMETLETPVAKGLLRAPCAAGAWLGAEKLLSPGPDLI